jgi:pSer/pThr/pTyr-binding forkhead associated (FHA) protein
MKLSLIVLTPGKMEGKTIPITLSQFLIGRDPQCQLRPASPLISKRHCALQVRDDRVFVHDFDSTNGTLINGTPIKGETELTNGDRLKVGPLEFRVVVEISVPVSKPTPPPPLSTAPDDEAAAALLLSLHDDDMSGTSGMAVDSEGIPTGSTLMEVLKPGTIPDEAPKEEEKSGAAKREAAAKTAQGNTSTAAKAILEKYMRRPRN